MADVSLTPRAPLGLVAALHLFNFPSFVVRLVCFETVVSRLASLVLEFGGAI